MVTHDSKSDLPLKFHASYEKKNNMTGKKLNIELTPLLFFRNCHFGIDFEMFYLFFVHNGTNKLCFKNQN